MKLRNEFTIDLPADRVWPVLLDVPRVAGALPGASVERGEEETYRGTMKVRLGPVTMTYAGTAVLEEVDEDERFARFRVQARDARGQGTATATIVNRVADAGGATRVTVETDLSVTGRSAQFGRGMMEEVASGMLGEFATRLEGEIEAAGQRPAGAAASAPVPADEALDLGAAVAGPLRQRAVLLGAGIAIGLLLGRAVWRR